MEITDKKITRRYLNEGKITDAIFYNCIFERIKVDSFYFRNCEFERCSFINCSVRNVKFDFFRLIDCKFKDCLLQGINTAEIMFPCTFSLENCDLKYVDFICAGLQKTVFLSSRFMDCVFEEADISRSDFTGSVFQNTEFRYSDLSYCDFTGTEGLDINHEINRIAFVKIPQEAGFRILNRMGVMIS